METGVYLTRSRLTRGGKRPESSSGEKKNVIPVWGKSMTQEEKDRKKRNNGGRRKRDIKRGGKKKDPQYHGRRL